MRHNLRRIPQMGVKYIISEVLPRTRYDWGDENPRLIGERMYFR